ncbi:MAG: hypothetical protein NWF00_12730 [Candidatus Bathyarchaeota archaeon]|nr:hypothetical protein [Candidatus Bathyarchaeota archaeon]
MEEDTPTFEKIDTLTQELKTIFTRLETRIANVEAYLRCAELDHMYGNMTEASYAERKRQINKNITVLHNVLVDLKKAESSLP